ncbi:hypothetical protein BH24ACT11_BH24ACT11_08060 [soil metagenome]
MGAQVTVLANPTAGAGRVGRVAAAAVDQLRRRGLPVAVIWGCNALHAAELAPASVERSDAALVDRRIGSVDVAAVSAAGLTAQVVSAWRRVSTPGSTSEPPGCGRGGGGRVTPRRPVAGLGCFTPLQYSLRLDGVRTDVEAMLVAVCNGPTYGGGLPICPPADPRTRGTDYSTW